MVFVIPCIFANSEVQEEWDLDLISNCKQTYNVAIAKLNAFEEQDLDFFFFLTTFALFWE